FSHLPTHCKFIALMPQWDFLNFFAEKGKLYPQFQLRMETEVIGLMEENGRVAGVRARTPQGVLEVRADLTVGADGRHSIVREKAGLEVIDLGAPIDVLWMRLARRPSDVHRRLRSCDVSGGRGRNQSRDPGRRCRREHFGAAAVARRSQRGAAS